MIATAYKDNKCIKTETFSNYLLKSGSVSNVTTNFSNLDADCVKMFIWNDLKSMTPIAGAREIKIKN